MPDLEFSRLRLWGGRVIWANDYSQPDYHTYRYNHTYSNSNPHSYATPHVIQRGMQVDLKSVTLAETSSYATKSGIRPRDGFLFLTVEFDNTDSCSLSGVAFGGDGRDPVFEKATLLKGIPTIYALDNQDNQFFAVEVGENYILVGVKKESSGFVLYIANMTPLNLGK